jgi:hypothetical protein
VKLATCATPSCASDGNVVLFFGGGQTICDGALVGMSMDCVPSSISVLMGSIHRSVDGSFFLHKTMFPLYHTLHLVLVNNTLHPASHRTLIPINDAIVNLGTTCPTCTFGRPGIVMSHVCVDFTFVPSGRLMVSGRLAGRMFLHRVPSMMKIEVAPVSAIACDAAMAIALRYCGFGAPNNCCAVAAIVVPVVTCPLSTFDKSCVRFDVTIVLSSLFTSGVALIIWVGYGVLA